VIAPAFLEPDIVLFLHDQSIREFGGYHGVRDEALLASALDRPKNRLGYESEADLAALVAAYAFGIAKNHAFLDGNKRTAWAACALFLKINGVILRARAAEAVENTVALATGGMSEAAFAAWLREVTA
jgi:death-on-curing protein